MKEEEIFTKKLDVVALETIQLVKGDHKDRSDGLSAIEVVAWLAGEEHSGQPKCVSPVLAAFVRRWNDNLDDVGRQKLKPHLHRMIGTAGDGHEELRGWLCADWVIRVHTPAWLELAGIKDPAAALRALPELRDLAALESAKATLDQARKQAAAAWAADRDADRDAAWDAAWAAAWAAAWDAALDAAWAADRDADRDTALDAAWAAAWAAAWDADRHADRKKLAPTVESLQGSALDLLDRLIDPFKTAS